MTCEIWSELRQESVTAASAAGGGGLLAIALLTLRSHCATTGRSSVCCTLSFLAPLPFAIRSLVCRSEFWQESPVAGVSLRRVFPSAAYEAHIGFALHRSLRQLHLVMSRIRIGVLGARVTRDFLFNIRRAALLGRRFLPAEDVRAQRVVVVLITVCGRVVLLAGAVGSAARSPAFGFHRTLSSV